MVIEEVRESRGLAFVMHGLGTNKDQPQIKSIAEVFVENGYTAVRFDCANSLGESEGEYEKTTTTNFLEDLEDVVGWASMQDWYQEPFFLAGSSLGGYATARFAELYPEKVKGLAPKATTISGKLSMETHIERNKTWKETGWRIEESRTRPGFIKRLPWSHMEDRMLHDLLPEADKLTMPVLMIVGDQDDTSPIEHQRMLYDKIPGRKEIHIIKGAPHTFYDAEHIAEQKKIFDAWIKTS